MTKIKRVLCILALTIAPSVVSSCAFEVVETPYKAGWELGQIFAETWLRMDREGWPSSDAAALYCADVVGILAKERGWELGKVLEATDGCAEGVVAGLENE